MRRILNENKMDKEKGRFNELLRVLHPTAEAVLRFSKQSKEDMLKELKSLEDAYEKKRLEIKGQLDATSEVKRLKPKVKYKYLLLLWIEQKIRSRETDCIKGTDYMYDFINVSNWEVRHTGEWDSRIFDSWWGLSMCRAQLSYTLWTQPTKSYSSWGLAATSRYNFLG